MSRSRHGLEKARPIRDNPAFFRSAMARFFR
jgi:hypothetical protein